MMAAISPSNHEDIVSPTTTIINAVNDSPLQPAAATVSCIIKNEMHSIENDDDSQTDLADESGVHVYPMNRPSSLCATLDTRSLWKQFDALGTEMIVTRRGRRMFPPIKVELHNLNPNSFYVLLMDLAPVDKYRYKYQNSKWVKCFEEACAPTRLYIHPESPALGSYWMDHIVSFYKLKLTNNQLDKQGHIIVNSMHSYQPRLHIVESSDRHNLNLEDFHTITFPGTQFTTVTAYQNDKITQLKIENNPFAKGFRQPMSRSRTRPIKLSYPPQSGSEAGSDDGIVYNESNSFVSCNSGLNSTHSNTSSYIRRMSLKRSFSGSDDEISVIKKANLHKDKQEEEEEEGLVHVTSQINNFISPHHNVTSNASLHPTPVYIVYTNGEATTLPNITTSCAPHIPTLSNTLSATNNSIQPHMPSYHIVHIPQPSSMHQNNIVPLTSSSPTLVSSVAKQQSHDHNTSSGGESDDSDSECEQSSHHSLFSAKNSLILPSRQPPPLISTVNIPPPTQQQSIIIPTGPGATTTGGYITQNNSIANSTTNHTVLGHGNGMLHHTPTQQILVPVNALSQIHGKSSILLQPLITTAQPQHSPVSHTVMSGNNIIQYVTPSNHIICTSNVSNTNSESQPSFIQTLPVISKQGNFIKSGLIANGQTTAIPTSTTSAVNSAGKQTFQLLTTLPRRTSHIVNQA